MSVGKARKLLAVLLLALPLAALPSCGSVQSTAGGAAELASLELVGQKASSVKVSVDGGSYFSARVNRVGKHSHHYTVPSGAHDIVVMRGGQVLVSKKIYASAGEVKIVEIP